MAETAGILFDLDETLIDRAASIRSYAEVFREEFSRYLGPHRDDFVTRFIALDGNGYVARDVFFQTLASEIDHPSLPAERIEAHYFQTIWEAPPLIEGAETGLRALRTLGMPIGIVTNGGSLNQRRKIDGSGLGALVDGCFISEEIGVKKPDPQIFQRACEQLDLAPPQSWFVGDNPLRDVAGSAVLGFRSIWLQRATAWPEELPQTYELATPSLPEVMRHLLLAFGGTACEESVFAGSSAVPPKPGSIR